MSRYDDSGAYEVGNVFIQTQSDNTKFRYSNRCVVQGVEYRSLVEASELSGISVGRLRKWIAHNNGWPMKRKPRKKKYTTVEINGVVYGSFDEAGQAFGLKATRILAWVQRKGKPQTRFGVRTINGQAIVRTRKRRRSQLGVESHIQY